MDTNSELELLAEIKKIYGIRIRRSNLVNVIALMSAAQEHGETYTPYLANVWKLSLQLHVMNSPIQTHSPVVVVNNAA